MKPSELTIKYAQDNQPWTVPYSENVQNAANDKIPYILATHNCLHAMKSVGKLATIFEALDHGNPLTQEQYETIKAMSADLLTAALRFANLYRFDLAAILVDRVKEKNGINILNLSSGVSNNDRE